MFNLINFITLFSAAMAYTLPSDTVSPATAETVALAAGLPVTIYPLLGPSENPGEDYSLISILLDVSWNFVTANPDSATQIFETMPLIIANAVDTTPEEVKPFALQAQIQPSFTHPVDSAQLQTLFLAYLPTTAVDVLALQLKARTSPFYGGNALAAHVVSTFPLTSVTSSS
ncbi:hypothetical protein B0H19DRAFT_1063476 [Mycena capillaripes]|nr:hypothetical protein B0H19DRAFT_1063476 [Mycena capillaripes]